MGEKLSILLPSFANFKCENTLFYKVVSNFSCDLRELSQVNSQQWVGGQQKGYFNTKNVYVCVGTWSKNAKNMFT